MTYGGDWVSAQVQARARRRGIKVVFALHNLAYRDRRLFDQVDAVLLPSQFAADWYRRELGVHGTAIPSLMNLDRIESDAADVARRYVTFVNPQAAKGAGVFARIAQELDRRRPNIPLLVVEGRGGASGLMQTGVELSGVTNLSVMATTPNPRDFYRVTRLVLMPSLCVESFGRVAAEAMTNGIPVLASDRGALPEVLGDAGTTLPIPERYTPETSAVPSADEVAPWVETIVRWWDDSGVYHSTSQQCRAAAQRWQAERLGPRYEAFFHNLLG